MLSVFLLIGRFQQSAASQNQGGFNGYQRPSAPQVPVWQNQNQNRFQGAQNFQHPASGFQVIPNQGFSGQQPFGVDGSNVSYFLSSFQPFNHLKFLKA